MSFPAFTWKFLLCERRWRLNETMRVTQCRGVIKSPSMRSRGNSGTPVRHRDAYGRDLGHTLDGLRKNVIEYDEATGRSGTMTGGPRSDAYGYNARSELVSATTDGVGEYAYQYDDIGNRTTSLDLGTNRTYLANALNQYTSISNLNASVPSYERFVPEYDADGNQTLVKTKTGIWQVSYNAGNRPVSWTCGAINLTMRFDRMGRRVEYLETVADAETSAVATNKHQRFVYDGYLCLQIVNARTGVAEYAFEWDPTEPVATRPMGMQRTGNWNLFYTHDGNKNVSELVYYQRARGVAARDEYAPFGAVTVRTRGDNWGTLDFSSLNPFRFSSEFADDALGLVYYNYRHYDPVTGRWLSRDPIEETREVFAEKSRCTPVDRAEEHMIYYKPIRLTKIFGWDTQAVNEGRL